MADAVFVILRPDGQVRFRRGGGNRAAFPDELPFGKPGKRLVIEHEEGGDGTPILVYLSRDDQKIFECYLTEPGEYFVTPAGAERSLTAAERKLAEQARHQKERDDEAAIRRDRRLMVDGLQYYWSLTRELTWPGRIFTDTESTQPGARWHTDGHAERVVLDADTTRVTIRGAVWAFYCGPQPRIVLWQTGDLPDDLCLLFGQFVHGLHAHDE